MRKTHFPGLDLLRAYAALSVIVEHLVSLSDGKIRLGQFFLTGRDAVTLFFVLSGFLIGYQILDELQTSGAVNIGRFYERRARRILPPYLLIVGLTTLLSSASVAPFVVPLGGTRNALLMLPEINMPELGSMVMLWSIGVEEKFYLIIPWVLRRISVPVLCLLIVVGRCVATYLFASNAAVSSVLYLWRFDAMMLGVLGAWLVIQRHGALTAVYRLQWPALGLGLLLIVFTPIAADFWFNLAVAFVAFLVIVNTATNPRAIIRLDRGPLAALGRVSYGLYLYHIVVIASLSRLGLFALPAPVALALALAATVAAAWLSYRCLELPLRHVGALPVKALAGAPRYTTAEQ